MIRRSLPLIVVAVWLGPVGVLAQTVAVAQHSGQCLDNTDLGTADGNRRIAAAARPRS